MTVNYTEVLRFFPGDTFINFKEVQKSNLQIRLLSFQCTCCKALVTSWRPHENYPKWTCPGPLSQPDLFNIFKMTASADLLHLGKQSKATGSVRNRFDAISVGTKLYCIARFQIVFTSRLHSKKVKVQFSIILHCKLNRLFRSLKCFGSFSKMSIL